MVKLPRAYEAFKRSYPEIWQAYDRLGILSHQAGPLDRKTRELVKLALAIGGKLEGAAHSHTRRALAAGATPRGSPSRGLARDYYPGFSFHHSSHYVDRGCFRESKSSDEENQVGQLSGRSENSCGVSQMGSGVHEKYLRIAEHLEMGLASKRH